MFLESFSYTLPRFCDERPLLQLVHSFESFVISSTLAVLRSEKQRVAVRGGLILMCLRLGYMRIDAPKHQLFSVFLTAQNAFHLILFLSIVSFPRYVVVRFDQCSPHGFFNCIGYFDRVGENNIVILSTFNVTVWYHLKCIPKRFYFMWTGFLGVLDVTVLFRFFFKAKDSFT